MCWMLLLVLVGIGAIAAVVMACLIVSGLNRETEDWPENEYADSDSDT